jgi:hypothetical protein
LARLPEGPPLTFRDGTLLKGSKESVYVIEHGLKCRISSYEVFKQLGYQWKNVMIVPDEALELIKEGLYLTLKDRRPEGTLVKGTDNPIYLLQGGQKRWFPSPQAFLSWGYQWSQVITVSDSELAGYPLGEPVTPQASFYLKDIQEAIRVNLRPEEVPDESFLSRLPQLIEGVANKVHLKELPGFNVGKKVLKIVT